MRPLYPFWKPSAVDCKLKRRYTRKLRLLGEYFLRVRDISWQDSAIFLNVFSFAPHPTSASTSSLFVKSARNSLSERPLSYMGRTSFCAAYALLQTIRQDCHRCEIAVPNRFYVPSLISVLLRNYPSVMISLNYTPCIVFAPSVVN